MPTSKYFDPYSDVGQQRLYKELINEVVQNWGIDSMYLPRESESTVDLFFGDDPTKKFTEAYRIEVYPENVESFDGGDLFTKFGLTINKQVRLLVGLETFNKQTAGVLGPRPREGDLLWLTNFKILFEIKYVNQDKFFYAFGNNTFYGFELVCEEFRYNNEKIHSGVEEIDDKVNEIAMAYEARMGSTGNNSYVVDEVVFQGANLAAANATASVASWNIIDKKLILKDIIGIFAINTVVHGVTSGGDFVLNSIELQDNVNDNLDNNLQIRTEANTILDTTESNAFGNPST